MTQVMSTCEKKNLAKVWLIIVDGFKEFHHFCKERRSSLSYSTSHGHEWHECDTTATRATLVQREWDMSDTCATWTTWVRYRWKTLILITRLVKKHFHTPILATHQVKNYKERNNFILRNNIWKCLFPMPKCAWKVHHKN